MRLFICVDLLLILLLVIAIADKKKLVRYPAIILLFALSISFIVSHSGLISWLYVSMR